MTQTIKTIIIPPQEDIVVFNAVNVLKRCFLGIYVVKLTMPGSNYIQISFADANFRDYFTFSHRNIFFECKGKNIFQGSILARNTATEESDIISATEILE